MAAMIEPQDKAKGARVATSDFFFARIGEPLPVEYAGEGGGGDARPYGPGHLPSWPLAISERFWLIFVAHSSGFCVARTWSVMGSAKGIQEGWRGPSVRQLSIVDVPVGAVGLLSLSPDSSTLAATVGGIVYFFSVDSLQRGISSDSASLC